MCCKPLILLAITNLFFSNSLNANELNIAVIAPRPVDEVVEILSEQLSCIITYEDPVFRSPEDLKEIYPKADRYIPKGASICYTYDTTNSKSKIIYGFIDKCNEEHNNKFRVIQKGDIYNVLPLQTVDFEGEKASPLDIPLTVSLEGTSCYGALDVLCDKISGEQYQINKHNMPISLMMNTPFSASFIDEPARNILNAILTALNSKQETTGNKRFMTWHLLYDPQSSPMYYVLSFKSIVPVSGHSMRLRIVAERPIAEAVKILENTFKTAITYEDPVYVCGCEMMGDEYGKRLTGGIVDLSWEASNDVMEVLTLLADKPIMPKYLPQAFKVSEESSRYRVYPNQSFDTDGDPVPITPLLNSEISFDIKEGNCLDFLNSVCSSLSERSKEKVNFNADKQPTMLTNMLKSQVIQDISINNQNAYQALNQFFENNNQISWQLLFNPTSNQFEFEIYEISE